MLTFLHGTILFYPVVVWLHMRTRAVTLTRWARLGQIQVWALTALTSSQWDSGIFYKGGELVNIFLGVQNIKIRQNRIACPTDTDLVLMFKKVRIGIFMQHKLIIVILVILMCISKLEWV